MDISELIYGLIVKMRCENEFDEDVYNAIKEKLKAKIVEWKKSGCVPNNEVVAIMSLIEQLVGGNRFFDEETAIRVEDASIEIMEIINELNSDSFQ